MFQEIKFSQVLVLALVASSVVFSSTRLYAQADSSPKADSKLGSATVQADGTKIEQLENGLKWLGVSATDVPEILKLHLPVLKDQGILIKLVVKDSPAEKSGIKENDILLALDGTKIKAMADLVTAVQNSKSPKATAEILRGGKRLEIPVQLETRAKYAKSELMIPAAGFEKMLGFSATGERLRYFGPGQLVPQIRIIKAEKLPENLSIQITRKGKAPAEITIKSNGKTWNTTENEIDVLPAEIRTHVQNSLKGAGNNQFRFGSGVNSDAGVSGSIILKADQFDVRLPSLQLLKEHQKRVEQQLEQMKKMIEQLRKDVTESKKQTPIIMRRKPGGAYKVEPVESAN